VRGDIVHDPTADPSGSALVQRQVGAVGGCQPSVIVGLPRPIDLSQQDESRLWRFLRWQAVNGTAQTATNHPLNRHQIRSGDARVDVHEVSWRERWVVVLNYLDDFAGVDFVEVVPFVCSHADI